MPGKHLTPHPQAPGPVPLPCSARCGRAVMQDGWGGTHKGPSRSVATPFGKPLQDPGESPSPLCPSLAFLTTPALAIPVPTPMSGALQPSPGGTLPAGIKVDGDRHRCALLDGIKDGGQWLQLLLCPLWGPRERKFTNSCGQQFQPPTWVLAAFLRSIPRALFGLAEPGGKLPAQTSMCIPGLTGWGLLRGSSTSWLWYCSSSCRQ